MSYLYGTNVELIYGLGVSVTKNTYTTAAAITPLATTGQVARVPASFWGDNPLHKGLHVYAAGTIGVTAAATFIGQACLNTTAGTLLAAGSFTYWPILTVTSGALWELDIRYTCTAPGTSATLQYNADYRQSVVASGTMSTAPQNVKTQGVLTTSVEVDQFVELFGTWSASNVLNTTTVQQFQVFGLN